MKLKSPLLLAAGTLFAFLSCASNANHYAQIDAGVEAGSYEAALASMQDETDPARKNIYTSKNQILYHLDKGMIEHYAGQYEESSQDLQAAELLIEEAYTKSLSQEIGSYLANDNMKDYSGEDYEDLYVNVFNSLNYYHTGNIEEALVEIRRLNEKLRYFADKYEQAMEKAMEDSPDMDLQQIPMEASSFSNSALARYLGILFYRGTGKPDDARIDYEELQRAFTLAPTVYTNPIPSSVQEELSVPADMGRLNVIAFTGLSPVKEEENITIPLPFEFPNNTANLAIPKIVNRPQIIERAEAVLDSGESFNLELLENMGAVAADTFKSKVTLIVIKTAVRTIVKAGVSAGAASAASGQDSSIGFLVGLAGRVATQASESADIRLARYFPCYAYVGGINLQPGSYNVTLNYYSADGGLVYSEEKEIDVQAGAVNLKEFMCLK